MRTLFGPGDSPLGSSSSDLGPHILHADSGTVLIPSRDILLQSMYARNGADLVLNSPENGKFVVKGFFLSDTPPVLTDGHGAVIAGDQAILFAGSLAPDQYAGQTSATGASIGQVRSLIGVAQVTRADGTTLALGEKGELVLDELVYDPTNKDANKQVLQLVSGAAEFVSGSIAKSGQDHMTFKTPVGTIGIRNTRVFASFDPVTGDVTILNRPTGVDTAGNITAGEIVLTLPNGQVIGNMTSSNGGWQWNPTQGQVPQSVQLTDAQVSGVIAGVEGVVSNLQTQQQQQQQQNTQPGGAQDQGGAQGGAQGGTPDAGANGTTTDGTTGAPAPGDGAAAPATGDGAAVAPPTTTTVTVTNTATNTTTTTTTTTPVVTPATFSLDGGGTVSDQSPNVMVFTITRGGNTTISASVNYAANSGSATSGSDFGAVSGTLTFAAGETSRQVIVPIFAVGRTELDETFTFSIDGASSGSSIAGNASATVTIPADLALPTLSINSVTVSDAVAPDSTVPEGSAPYFKVVIRTAKTYLGDEKDGYIITPGMGATVDIHTGTKAVISYLVKPVLKLKTEAFRER